MDATRFSAMTMVDIVIAVTAVEAVVLWLYHRHTGKGLAGRDFLPTLLSGLLLMVALRLHMAGMGWMPTAALLAGAGVFHTVDLRRRWRSPNHPPRRCTSRWR
jgi:hypothetical protein